jgi:hypothetical protein
VEIVAEWRLAPMWCPWAVYPYTVLKLLELCVGGDNARVGGGWLVAATKWNLLHPIYANSFEHDTWIRSLSLSRKHEKLDGS